MNLQELQTVASTCTLCELCGGRNQPVFARGSSDTDVLICGMCPGPDENIVGSPFVGRAGRILDEVLDHASLCPEAPQDVYITNLVKCFVKPGISLEEKWMTSCWPYFIVQLELIKPRVVIALGGDVSNFLLGTNLPMKELRGKVFDYMHIKLVSTWHPSYVLRSGGANSKQFGVVVDDFKLAYASR